MVTNNYTYPTKMVYPKPIVVYKQCHGDPIDVARVARPAIR